MHSRIHTARVTKQPRHTEVANFLFFLSSVATCCGLEQLEFTVLVAYSSKLFTTQISRAVPINESEVNNTSTSLRWIL